MQHDTLPFITTGDEAKRLVKEVVRENESAVTSTMGPNGRLAAITIGVNPKVTKDGVTVARALKFNDPRKELVNKIITEPSVKTDELCGDGTTTTIMLMGQYFNIYTQFPQYHEQAFIEKVTKEWIEELRNMSILLDVDDDRLYQMALTTSNNDEAMSRIVVDLYKDSKGSFPSIELIDGVEDVDRVVRTNGLRMNMELSNPGYAGHSGGIARLKRYVPVLVDSFIRPENVDQVDAFISAMVKQYQSMDVTVLICARAIENVIDGKLLKANSVLAQNKSPLRFIGVRTNLGGSMGSNIMQDMACMLNTSMVSDLEQALDVDWLVSLNSELTINNNKATLIPDEVSKARIAERIESIKEVIGNYDARTRWSRRARADEDRLRNLSGEVINLWVGGETHSDVKERHARFEDVVKAVKSGLVNGILPGCGTSLIYSMEKVGAKFLTGDITDEEKAFRQPIIGALVAASRYQYEYLMRYVSSVYNLRNEEDRLLITNLATDVDGTPEELGVYDTAFASIMALKGGSQTAKILASLDSILISDKLGQVQVIG